MRIQFIKSPTGAFGLGYNEGDIKDLPDVQAMEIVESGFAIIVQQPALSEAQKKMLEYAKR